MVVKSDTLEFVIPLENFKTIGLKWVFKVKKNTKGEIIKHKPRLVLKGFSQSMGLIMMKCLPMWHI